MARLDGSFPFKINGQEVGTVYILGHDEYGITCDIRLKGLSLLDDVTELIKLGDLPTISFDFVTEPILTEPETEPDCGV